MKLCVSIGNSRMDKKWNGVEMEWKEFAERLSHTIRTAETMEQYKKSSKAKQDDIKDVGGFVLGKLKGGRRKKDCVISRSAISLDMDYGTKDIIEQLELLFDMKCLIYSTHKHTPENPRLRLIVPLTREISPDEYSAVSRKLADEIGIELFDDSTYEPSRLMYWPSTCADGQFVYKDCDGKLVNPDEVLAKYTNWHDVSSWPVSNRQNIIIERSIKKQEEPLTKGGLIGAFNRTYTISQAMDTYISDVYRPSAMAGRYDYVPADSSAGVVVYEDKFVYSHHSTDPCCGKLMNAFDVIRLHKFGSLDSRTNEDTESTKLPSYKAMQEFISKEEAVKKRLVEERTEQASSEFQTDNWQMALELDRQGKVKDTLENIVLIFQNDSSLQSIAFNRHRDGMDARERLPWEQIKEGWNDSDNAALKVYLNHIYGVYSPSKTKDAIMAVAASRAYHPIMEYLESLPTWDGVQRVDNLLIDYFGADKNGYTKAVIRKTLVAAVARIYHPGTKFDSVLILNGPQGIGKSTFFSKLAGAWFSDSLALTDMRDKSGPEKLQGYWILELGELAGMRKTDVETVKSFISRVDDKYRASYGVNVESHPRQSVVVGSTNAESGFLRDITGNRRFWPVRIDGSGSKKPWKLEKEEVDQIWAETIVIYKQDEKLYLEGEDANIAMAEQADAMESDEREGLIRRYLDTLLPEEWDGMSLFERRNFLNGSEFGAATYPITNKRMLVCNMEIWCECFGKEESTLKKIDSYELNSMLKKIEGWKIYTGTKTGMHPFPIYGRQRALERE